MVNPSLRVLALVTDAFGGHGGIAQYNRDFLTSLATCEGIDDVIVLPRESPLSPGTLPTGVRQLGAVKGRLAYSLAALRAVQAHRPIDVVFCGHLFMTPLAAAIARLLHASLWVQVHGVDAWEELSSPYRRSLATAALITSGGRYTGQRLLQWVGIDPARVEVPANTVLPPLHPGPNPAYLLHPFPTSP